MTLPRAAQQHYSAQQRIVLATVLGLRRLWSKVEPGAIAESWGSVGRQALGLLGAGQLAAVRESTQYVPQVLAELDIANEPVARLDPTSLVGWTSSGRPLSGLLDYPVMTAKTAIASGASPQVALQAGRGTLDGITQLQLADAGRAAESIEMGVRPQVTAWTRMLRLPSCPRCAILAGRVYRWSDGFARHPRCDCVHIPSSDDVAGDLRTDPLEAIRAGQVRGLSKAELHAIAQEGTDPAQVVNAHRGMHVAGVHGRRLQVTSAGMVRGLARSRLPDGAHRLTVGTIYKVTGGDRVAAQKLLYRNGYLLDPPKTKPITSSTPRLQAAVKTPPPAAAPGGPRKPPPRPPLRLVAPNPEPGPEDRDYWRRRQEALNIETHGEVLEPGEVRFVEEFQGLGHSLEWIPRNPEGKSTHDFIWLNNNNLEMELKTTRQKYKAIQQHIVRAASRARAHGIAKENFIISVGSHPLRGILLRQLEELNIRNPNNRISGLWVLAAGALDRIDLK